MNGTTVEIAPWALAMLTIGAVIAGGLLVWAAITWAYHSGYERAEYEGKHAMSRMRAVAEDPEWVPSPRVVDDTAGELVADFPVDVDPEPEVHEDDIEEFAHVVDAGGRWVPATEDVSAAREQHRLESEGNAA